MSAKYMRQVRTAVLEELNKEYVNGAMARGVSERVILWKSVMRSALLTIVTLLALSIGSLLGGTAIVESIFMWDGVGTVSYTHVNQENRTVRSNPANLVDQFLDAGTDFVNSCMIILLAVICSQHQDNLRQRLM